MALFIQLMLTCCAFFFADVLTLYTQTEKSHAGKDKHQPVEPQLEGNPQWMNFTHLGHAAHTLDNLESIVDVVPVEEGSTEAKLIFGLRSKESPDYATSGETGLLWFGAIPLPGQEIADPSPTFDQVSNRYGPFVFAVPYSWVVAQFPKVAMLSMREYRYERSFCVLRHGLDLSHKTECKERSKELPASQRLSQYIIRREDDQFFQFDVRKRANKNAAGEKEQWDHPEVSLLLPLKVSFLLC